MFIKFMRTLSILMLIGFSIAVIQGRFPEMMSPLGTILIYGGLAFLLFAVGYLIVHYVRKIRFMIKN